MAAIKGFGLVRQFSTSASREALAKAPIQVFGIEGRYAHALFSAATKKNSLSQVDKEMHKLQGILQTDKKFADFLYNPTIQRKAKRDAVQETLRKEKFSDVTVNFFGALAENGRLNKTESFLAAFEKIMMAVRGEVMCTVTTAKPLDAKQTKELTASLNQFLKQGQTMKMTMEVNPALIGGMTVSLGDKFIDMSISAKLNTYEGVLKQAI